MATRRQTEPKRPKTVPAEAVFDATDQQWELGERNAKGNPIGEWRYWWSTTGHLCCISNYENGGRKHTYTRLHPDGTYSIKGIQLDGKPAPNEVIYCQKSKRPTTELSLTDPTYKKVFRVEERYIREGLSTWKNFNAKGQRIRLDGTRLSTLAPEAYAKNFGAFELPEVLARLVAFQNEIGDEMFAGGFTLEVDNNDLLKGFCGSDGRPLASKSKQREFLAAFLPIGYADGTGSRYYVWNDGASQNVSELPVVVFGSEGGHHVVAENLNQLLSLVATDVEPTVDFDEVSYFVSPDHEPSPGIDAFRRWLKDEVGILPTKKPDALVHKAQKRCTSRFTAWLKPFANH